MRSAFEMMMLALERLRQCETSDVVSKQETVDAVRQQLLLIMTALLTQPLHVSMAAPFQVDAATASTASNSA